MKNYFLFEDNEDDNILNRIIRKLKSIFKKIKFNEARLDISIHPDSYLGEKTYVGEGTNINGPCYIASSKENPCYIGKYCAIAHNLRVRITNHKYQYANMQCKFQRRYDLPKLNISKGSVQIGNNVWIGDNVIILSGVKIGDGAIIGAGSVVTNNIPSFAIAVGDPAKVIKYRFDVKTRNKLLRIKWWDWDEEKIKRNKWFFEIDLSKIKDYDIFDKIIE